MRGIGVHVDLAQVGELREVLRLVYACGMSTLHSHRPRRTGAVDDEQVRLRRVLLDVVFGPVHLVELAQKDSDIGPLAAARTLHELSTEQRTAPGCVQDVLTKVDVYPA